MKSFLEKDIDDLKEKLTTMAAIVEEQFHKILVAMDTANPAVLKGIKEKDAEIDAYDVLIQTLTTNILATYHPFASDLRSVISSIMINTQLERCGDLSVRIANRLLKILNQKKLITETNIYEMAKTCSIMLHDSISSFLNDDKNLAMDVISRDDIVDRINYNSFLYITNKMKTDSSLVEPCSHLLLLFRHLERLADHTTNIAEDVVFKISGEIVSHRNAKENVYEDELEYDK